MIKRRRPAPARPRKRRATYRKSYAKPQRSLNQYVHRFTRMRPTQTVQGSVTGTVSNAWVYNMGDLVNVNEFANLYDQYRIDYIVQKWYLRFDTSGAAPSIYFMPRVLWARDLDSNTVVTSAEIRERSQTRQTVLTPTRPLVIKYKPNVNREVFSSAGVTTFEPAWKRWLDFVATGTRHYGHLTVVENLPETMYIDIETKFYFSCKQAR